MYSSGLGKKNDVTRRFGEFRSQIIVRTTADEKQLFQIWKDVLYVRSQKMAVSGPSFGSREFPPNFIPPSNTKDLFPVG
jgi:hypothetical protein